MNALGGIETVAHELGHVLIQEAGLNVEKTNRNLTFVEAYDKEEEFCEDFAHLLTSCLWAQWYAHQWIPQ